MSRFSGKVVAPALVLGAALVGGPIIYDAMRPTSTYCTDASNVIVDDARCDNTNSTYGYGHGYYLHRGYYGSYGVGSILPSPRSGRDTRVEASDSAGRSKAGYSSSGKVASGRSGGFGFSKGGSGGSGDSGHGGGGGKSGGS